MARGRPRKDSPDVLVKSAEFVGWALGGLEREIAQTRERLSALTEHAVKLRSHIDKGKSAAAGATERQGAPEQSDTQPVGRRQRRRQMSPEARQRISEMMKKRWAQRRKAKG
jgi:hypothetical protein